MPKINTIKIINAQFDNGKSIYADFSMPLDGKTAIYSLKNGGGKSVLMQLAFQSILPNSYFDSDKRFRDMFKGGQPNRTTYSMIEWILDEGYETMYLLTGIVARKDKSKENDNEGDKDGVDWFTFTVEYDNPNSHPFSIYSDVFLIDNGESDSIQTFSYDKARELLLTNKKNHNIKVFSLKNEYQVHLRKYGLVDIEWEFLRELNKSENYLVQHFKKYPTSRALIEKLIINYISKSMDAKKDIYKNEGDDFGVTENIAVSLYDSREDLLELKRETRIKDEYLQLINEISYILPRNEELLKALREDKELERRVAAQVLAHQEKLKLTISDLDESQENLREMSSLATSLENEKQSIELDLIWSKLTILKQEFINSKEAKNEAEKNVKNSEYAYKLALSTNKYLDREKAISNMAKIEIELNSKDRSNEELSEKRNNAGVEVSTLVTTKKIKIEENIKTLDTLKKDETEKNEEAITKIAESNSYLNDEKRNIKRLQKNIDDFTKDQNSKLEDLKKLGGYRKILLSDELEELGKINIKENQTLKEAEDNLYKKNENLKAEVVNIKLAKLELKQANSRVSDAEGIISEFLNDEEAVKRIVELHKIEDIFEAPEKLQKTIDSLKNEKKELVELFDKNSKEIDILQAYGMCISDEILEVAGELKETLGYAELGLEFLQSLDEADRVEALSKIPMLPKVVFVTNNDFNSIKNGKVRLSVAVQDSMVPIINSAIILKKEEVSYEDIFIPSRSKNYYINSLNSEKRIKKLTIENVKLLEQVDLKNSSINRFEIDFKAVLQFTLKYDVNSKERFIKNLEDTKRDCTEINETIQAHKDNEEVLSKEISILKDSIARIKEELADIIIKIELVSDILMLEKETVEMTSMIEEANRKITTWNEEITKHTDKKEKCAFNLENLTERIRTARNNLDGIKKIKEKFCMYAADETLHSNSSVERVIAEFEGYNDSLGDEVKGLQELEKKFKEFNSRIKELEGDITDSGMTIEDIEIIDNLQHTSEYQKTTLKNDLEGIQKKCKFFEDDYNSKKTKYDEKKGIYKEKRDGYIESGNEYCPPELNKGSLIYEQDFLRVISDLDQIKGIKNEEQERYNKLLDKKYEFDGDFKGHSNCLETYFEQGALKKAEKASELEGSNDLLRVVRDNKEEVKRKKQRFYSSVQNFKRDTKNLRVQKNYKDNVYNNLKTPNAIEESIETEKRITEYKNHITEKIEITEKRIEKLEEIEEEYVNQILHYAKNYKDKIKMLPKLSRVRLEDGVAREMVRINFETCEYSGERAKSEAARYIRSIIVRLENGQMEIEDVKKELTPRKIIGIVLDMSKIVVNLNKISEHGIETQMWDKFVGSDGERNASYIIFTAVIISFVRSIIVNERGMISSKVMFVDNPFGPTSSPLLWKRVHSLLEINDIQMISPTHNVPSAVLEYFPVHHQLTKKHLIGGKAEVITKNIQSKVDVMNFNRIPVALNEQLELEFGV